VRLVAASRAAAAQPKRSRVTFQPLTEVIFVESFKRLPLWMDLQDCWAHRDEEVKVTEIEQEMKSEKAQPAEEALKVLRPLRPVGLPPPYAPPLVLPRRDQVLLYGSREEAHFIRVADVFPQAVPSVHGARPGPWVRGGRTWPSLFRGRPAWRYPEDETHLTLTAVHWRLLDIRRYSAQEWKRGLRDLRWRQLQPQRVDAMVELHVVRAHRGLQRLRPWSVCSRDPAAGKCLCEDMCPGASWAERLVWCRICKWWQLAIRITLKQCIRAVGAEKMTQGAEELFLIE